MRLAGTSGRSAIKTTRCLPLALLISTACTGLGNDFIVPGPGRDTVYAKAGDDIVVIFDLCELEAGEILDGGRGQDTLVLPVDQAQVEAIGVTITNFETAIVEPHACLSQCGPQPDCGQGRCVDGASAGQWSCECNNDRLTGASCDTCEAGYGGPDCSACATGYHLEHVSGSLGPQVEADGEAEDEDFGIDWDEHSCVLDESCAGVTCSGRGTCNDSAGVAACACDPGYVGLDCETCAPGYEDDGSGACALGSSCRDEACSGRGYCVPDGRGLACACDRGVTGGQCTECAPGYHGVGDTCVLDERCTPSICSGNGSCYVEDGEASCVCDPDYYGEDCSRTCLGNRTCSECAPGHVRFGDGCVLEASCDAEACGGNGSCDVAAGRATCRCDSGHFGPACGQTNPPTRVTIQGGARSIDFGEVVQLTAVPVGIGNFGTSFSWQIVQGGGSLDARGTRAIYTAPTTGPDLETVIIAVTPDCCPGSGWQTPVVVGNSSNRPPIPIDKGGGSNGHLFEPLDRAMIDLMTDRCIGAAAVAVSRYGVEVYRAGYGRLDGAPVDDADWPWQARCGNDPYKPHSSNMNASTPIRLGSNSKPLLAAVMRDLVAQRIGQVQGDNVFSPVDPILELENIRLCPAPAGPDYFLLPPDIEDRLCGLLPVDKPQHIDLDPPKGCTTADHGEPCFNGGTCGTVPEAGPGLGNEAIEVTYVPHCTCPCPDPVGDPDHCYSGERCQRAGPEAEPPMADPRWRDVTLGHILRHRSGLRSSSKAETDVIPELGTLRNLISLNTLLPEQNKLLFLPNLQAAWTQLQEERGVTGTDMAFFVPGVTLQEIYRVTAGRPLYSDPLVEDYEYSNSGFALQQTIVEHLAGQFQDPFTDPDEAAPRPFSSLPGQPLLHEGSPLQVFLQEKLGIFGGQASAYGMFPARYVPSQVGPGDLVYRVYSENGYYGAMEWDQKRPDCVFDFTRCDFTAWTKGPRFDYELEGAVPTKVFAGLEGTGRAAGLGSLVVELPLYLRFMREYYIAGTSMEADRSVGYGTPRTSWTISKSHTGVTGIAKSWMAQHVRAQSYSIPPRGPDGRILLDKTDDELITHSCILPDGIDVIMSVNQAKDKPCKESDSDTTCGDYYDRRDDYVLHGLCGVDWTSVTVPPVVQLGL